MASGTINTGLKVFTYSENVTTSSSGAVSIPTELKGSFFMANYDDGKTGLIFKRDNDWVTCLNNSLSPVSNTSIKIKFTYLAYDALI